MKVLKALIYAEEDILPLYWAVTAEDMSQGVDRQGKQVEECYQQIALQKLGNNSLFADDTAVAYLLPLRPSETPTLPGAPSWTNSCFLLPIYFPSFADPPSAVARAHSYGFEPLQ